MRNKNIKERIIYLSYKHKLSHIGSCLTSVDIIEDIYSRKKQNERILLGNGHAGLAMYCVIEQYMYVDAEELLAKYGIHPVKSEHIDCTSGSLGHTLPIAVGMALADRTRNVYVIESDGSMMEGSNWEALRIAAELELDNLHIYFDFNGYSAYKLIDIKRLKKQIMSFLIDKKPKIHFRDTNLDDFPEWLQGIKSHYLVLDSNQYYEICRVC